MKQKRLNELDVVLSLHLHQLQCVEQDDFPRNLASILVFTTNGLQRLRSRIIELDQVEYSSIPIIYLHRKEKIWLNAANNWQKTLGNWSTSYLDGMTLLLNYEEKS